MAKHSWTAVARRGLPAMTCANADCPIVWWPDRREPKSQCRGAAGNEPVQDLLHAIFTRGEK